MKDYILTYSKTKFYPLDPILEDIKIEDIAHSLAQMARANGHFIHFYSVAQHSVNCFKEARARGYSERIQLGCLLHDASEAYLADITRPVKKYLSEYLIFEEKLQRVIYERFNIGDVSKEELEKIQEIDDAMLFYEFRELMGEDIFPVVPFIKERHDFSRRNYEEVEREFIKLSKILSEDEINYKYIGIDGCKGGWVVVAITKDDFEINVFKNLQDIMNENKESKTILIDMPIGLRENQSEIRPEDEARKLLVKRSSCVFNVPCRQAVYAKDYKEANELNKSILCKGISAQSYAICSKIKEVDEFLHMHSEFKNQLLEAHPEVCFAKLNFKTDFKEPIYDNKKTAEGMKMRFELLRRYYNKTDHIQDLILKDRNFLRIADDIVDALCLAVTGMIGDSNGFGFIPEKPMKDCKGIYMQMVFAKQ